MQLDDIDIIGHNVIDICPEYIYIEISSGTIDEIILSGIEPLEV